MTLSSALSGLNVNAAAIWLKRAVVAGSVIVLGLISARAFWLLADPHGAVSNEVGVVSMSSTAAGQPALRADLSILTRLNPFSKANAELTDIVTEAPETALNLVLSGLRAQTGEGQGSAVIKTPDNLQALYEPGDEILAGVSLERVLSDRVEIRRNGRLESLFLTDARGALSVIEDQETRQIVSGEAAEPVSPVAPNTLVVANMSEFLAAIRLDPVRADNVTVGYRLLPRDDGSALAAAGFETGDAVLAINGAAIGDIDGEEFIEELESARGADLTVLRDGEETTQRLIVGGRTEP